MEGMIPHSLFTLAEGHLEVSHDSPAATRWKQDFISQLLHMSHSQWIYRNYSLHNHTVGYLRLKQRDAILVEISRLAELDVEDLPPESQFLLEVDFAALSRAPSDQQEYWVLAVKAARKAGRRRAVSTYQRRRTERAQRWSKRIPPRRARPSRLSLGTMEIEQEIDGVRRNRKRPVRPRPSVRAAEAAYPSEKRHRPD